MTLPDKPLVIADFDLEKLTLRENRILFGSKYSIDDFYQFLLDRVDHAQSWTVEEIGNLTRADLAAVREKTMEALTAFFVPLANNPRSEPGRAETPTPSPAGSA